MRYLAPTGEFRELPQADLGRFVAAQRAKDAARPVPRAAAPAKRQSIDGSPCPRCGASGYSDCAHQIAAARPMEGKQAEAAKLVALPYTSSRDIATPDQNDAALADLLAFIDRHKMTRTKAANMLGRSVGGSSGLFRMLEERRARVQTIEKIGEMIRDYEERK